MTAKAKPRPRPRRTERSAPVFVPPTATAVLRPEQIVILLGISARTFYTMRSRGEYPEPDVTIGQSPRWSVALHNRWMDEQRGGKA